MRTPPPSRSTGSTRAPTPAWALPPPTPPPSPRASSSCRRNSEVDKSPMRRRQRGLTLIEAMISITIGLVVIGAVSYVYLSSKGAYRGNESIARIQEAGRFALDAITRDLRRGGALGCGTAASVTTVSLVNIGVLVGNTTTTID